MVIGNMELTCYLYCAIYVILHVHIIIICIYIYYLDVFFSYVRGIRYFLFDLYLPEVSKLA